MDSRLQVLLRKKEFVNKSRRDINKRVADDSEREILHLMHEYSHAYS
jgi:hypothetical protein